VGLAKPAQRLAEMLAIQYHNWPVQWGTGPVLFRLHGGTGPVHSRGLLWYADL